MIRAVVGAGPRVGTSYVMMKLHEAGLPVDWDDEFSKNFPVEGNPHGYYETDPINLHSDRWVNSRGGKILKVWPLTSNGVPIERMVVLKRDRAEQVKSLAVQMEREDYHEWHPVDLIEACCTRLESMKAKRLEVFTNEIDERLDEIIEFMRAD